MKEKLLLGVGRKKITPKIGACLYGYRPGLVSTAVNDDLTSTAFYFKQGNASALLVSVTVGSVREDITEDIFSRACKKHGIPTYAAIMNSIHTHSAPNVTGTYGWGDVDREYCDEIFIPETLAAIDEAVKNARPARMAIASGESLIGVNRRQTSPCGKIDFGQDPAGVFDPQMTILSFCDDEERPIANIIHYGAHATAAGKNTEISRDWPGVMIDMLEEHTGAVTAFINGPEGDVGPRLSNGETTGGGDIGYAIRHGEWAGRDAIRIYDTAEGYHVPRLFAYEGKLDIPLMPRISLEEARREHEKFKDFTVNSKGQLEKYYRDVIDSYGRGYTDVSCRTINQSIIILGDLAIVAFPFELFSEIGLNVKKESRFAHVLSLSNSNGSMGYLSTEREIIRGGYEITMARTSSIQAYAPDADRHITIGTLKNLKSAEDTLCTE